MLLWAFLSKQHHRVSPGKARSKGVKGPNYTDFSAYNNESASHLA